MFPIHIRACSSSSRRFFFFIINKMIAYGSTHPNPGLSFIGTDPLYERRGAASLLLQWALRQCLHDNTPAYLESTVDAGPLYGRLGFTVAEKISMLLDGSKGESVVYEEVCFIFRPSTTPDDMRSHSILQSDIVE